MSNCCDQQEAILGESNLAAVKTPAMPSVLGHSYWNVKGFGGLHWGINKLGDVNQQAILCKMQIPPGPEMADYSIYQVLSTF
jgi:hypothetical protein